MKTGVSYFGNRMLHHFKQDLQDIKAHNCNYILHCFSENDYFFYKETMRDFVNVSHNAGLEVHIAPWGVGGVFGGEADWRWVPQNLDACQVRNDGMLLGLGCPNHPKFREFMRDWTRTAVEIGGDVIFWDEPHFYIPESWNHPKEMWGCCCSICKSLFRERFGHDMHLEKTEEINQFQEARLMDFLLDMCNTVKEANPKTRNCLCLLPQKQTTAGWFKFAAIPTMDIFGTDPYWVGLNEPVNEFVRYFSEPVAKLANDFHKEGQIWIQAFRIPAGMEEDVGIAIDTAFDCGIRNLSAWGYRGCGFMSNLQCGNSDKVWDIIGRKYGELLQKSSGGGTT